MNGWRANFEAFYRRAPARGAEERGAMVTYDAGRGINVRVGARLSTGQSPDRWYLAGVTVPIANLASMSLEQTRSITATGTATSKAVGLQIPIGRVRLMQRYQITDSGFVDQPLLN